MITLRTCAICGSHHMASHRGLVAPFLAKRIWSRSAFAAVLQRCKECGFEFFNPRLSSEEERRLYEGYRGPEYHKARFATEPWYTQRLNASLSAPQALAIRKERVSKALHASLPASAVIRTVLDFGGARGELVQGLVPGAEAFVYDISNVEVLPGLTSVAMGAGHTADLIICSNVFEHVASPRAILQQIVSFSKPGTYVFIEVPRESPMDARTKLKRVAQSGILAVARPRTAWNVVKFRTTFVMHEHLNFYSSGSLRKLTETVPAMRVVAEGAYSIGSSRTIWILAQLGQSLPSQTNKEA